MEVEDSAAIFLLHFYPSHVLSPVFWEEFAWQVGQVRDLWGSPDLSQCNIQNCCRGLKDVWLYVLLRLLMAGGSQGQRGGDKQCGNMISSLRTACALWILHTTSASPWISSKSQSQSFGIHTQPYAHALSLKRVRDAEELKSGVGFTPVFRRPKSHF